jgi:DNA-3-methyladenine glycosylase
MKLPQSFYTHNDVLSITRNLLGKYLFTRIDGILTGGYIVEAEAYNGVLDKASHAHGGRLTPRTQTMYKRGGIAYVYLCYGIHEMFNVVTSSEGEPHAVLIRAIEPTDGVEEMLLRRNMQIVNPKITSGPGSVAKALGISRKVNTFDLQEDVIWIEDRGLTFADEDIVAGPRVGVDYAAEDALLPYRLYVEGNKYVSRPLKASPQPSPKDREL